MKTDDIYIAQLAVTTKIETKGDLEDYLFGEGVTIRPYYEVLNYILVKIKPDEQDNLVAKDLKTNQKYSCKIPTKMGKLFITTNFCAFNVAYPNVKKNLFKRKILKMGEVVLQELKKEENSKKRRSNI